MLPQIFITDQHTRTDMAQAAMQTKHLTYAKIKKYQRCISAKSVKGLFSDKITSQQHGKKRPTVFENLENVITKNMPIQQ